MVLRIGMVLLVAVILAVAAFLVFGREPVEAPSSVYPEVTIECDAWTGASAERCGSWGDELLAAGPPSRTFNMTDLRRLALQRPMLGLAGACRVEYYLGRNPTSPVWDDETACRE